jgi:hypothetical protein
MRAVTAELCPIGFLPKESQWKYSDWMFRMKDKVGFNMDSLRHHTACMLTVKWDGEPIAFVALTKPKEGELQLGELCHEPGISKRVLSLGLSRIFELVKKVMRDTKATECYFNCNDAGEVAAVCKRGWEKVAYTAETNTTLLRFRQAVS